MRQQSLIKGLSYDLVELKVLLFLDKRAEGPYHLVLISYAENQRGQIKGQHLLLILGFLVIRRQRGLRPQQGGVYIAETGDNVELALILELRTVDV